MCKYNVHCFYSINVIQQFKSDNYSYEKISEEIMIYFSLIFYKHAYCIYLRTI